MNDPASFFGGGGDALYRKGGGGEILSASHQDLGENEVCGSSLMGPYGRRGRVVK